MFPVTYGQSSKDLGASILKSQFGGVASGTVVTSGGELIVSSGGAATSVTISRGGTLDLVGGGIAQATFSGGTLILPSTTATGQVVNGSMVAELVLSSATMSGAAVTGSGLLKVSAGGVADGRMIGSGGTQFVNSLGVASGTVLAGGQEVVFAGGIASSSTVSSGGDLVVSGGLASGANLLPAASSIWPRCRSHCSQPPSRTRSPTSCRSPMAAASITSSSRATTPVTSST